MKLIVKEQGLFFIYMLIIGLYYISNLAYVDNLNTKWLVYASMLPAFLKILGDRYKAKSLLGLSIILLLGIVIYSVTSESTVLIIVCTIICMKGVNSRDAVKILYYLYLCAIIVIFVFCFLGILQDNIVIMGNRYRHSFGFAHPNILAMTVLDILLMKIFIYGIRDWRLESIKIAIITMLINYFTDSRTVVLLMIFLILMIVAVNIVALKPQIMKCAVNILLLLGFGSFFVFITQRQNFIVQLIDRALNYRITLLNRFYDVYGLNFIGHNIWNRESFQYYVLDQGYANVLIRFGILGALIVMLSFSLMTKYAYKYNKYIYVIAIIILLYAFSENVLTSLDRNLMWFIFADSIYSSFSKIRSKE